MAGDQKTTDAEDSDVPIEQGEKGGALAMLGNLPDIRRIEPLIRHLPQLRANLGTAIQRVFGSPDRSRSAAGAKATGRVIGTAAEATSIILKAAAEHEAAAIADGKDPELARRAIERLGASSVRSQRNLEKTLGKVGEAVVAVAEAGDATGEIDGDWLDEWCRIAGSKSKEEIQELLAKMLVGEAHRPESFSPTTLQILSVMTSKLAQSFQRLCNLSIANLNVTTMVLWLDDPSPGTIPGNELKRYGLSYDDLMILHSLGLLVAIIGTFCTLSKDRKYVLNYAGRRGEFTGMKGAIDATLDNIIFSPAGAELRNLIVLAPVPEYTESLKTFLRGRDIIFVVSDE